MKSEKRGIVFGFYKFQAQISRNFADFFKLIRDFPRNPLPFFIFPFSFFHFLIFHSRKQYPHPLPVNAQGVGFGGEFAEGA